MSSDWRRRRRRRSQTPPWPSPWQPRREEKVNTEGALWGFLWSLPESKPRPYPSACSVSVATGPRASRLRSQRWRWEAESRTQKTAGLDWDQRTETTPNSGAPPPRQVVHSASGQWDDTMWSLMLPSEQPTWSTGTAPCHDLIHSAITSSTQSLPHSLSH